MVENVLFVISLPEKKKKRTDSAVEMMDQLDYFHPAMLPPPSMYDHGKPLLLCIVTVRRFVYVTNKNIVTVRPSKVNVCTLYTRLYARHRTWTLHIQSRDKILRSAIKFEGTLGCRETNNWPRMRRLI